MFGLLNSTVTQIHLLLALCCFSFIFKKLFLPIQIFLPVIHMDLCLLYHNVMRFGEVGVYAST